MRVILAPRVVVRGGRSEQVCYYGNGIRGRIQLWGWGIYSPLSVQYYGDYRYCIPLHHIGEVRWYQYRYCTLRYPVGKETHSTSSALVHRRHDMQYNDQIPHGAGTACQHSMRLLVVAVKVN